MTRKSNIAVDSLCMNSKRSFSSHFDNKSLSLYLKRHHQSVVIIIRVTLRFYKRINLEICPGFF